MDLVEFREHAKFLNVIGFKLPVNKTYQLTISYFAVRVNNMTSLFRGQVLNRNLIDVLFR